MLKRFLLSALCLFIAASSVSAQQKKLEPQDYGQWQYISATALSPDGNWFAYNTSLVDGDGWLTIKEVGSDSTGTHTFMHGVRPDFSDNSRWAAFLIGVSEEEQEKLEKQDKQLRFKAGLMNLATARVDTFPGITGFAFSGDGRYLALRKYKAEGVKTEGTDLIVRDLQNGTNQIIGNVADFGFSPEGSLLAVRIDASGQLGNGVQVYDLAANTIRVLDSDTTAYAGLSWHEDRPALTFLKERTEEGYEEPTHLVYSFRDMDRQEFRRQVFDQRNQDSFPDSMRIVAYRNPQWSEDGERLFFGVKQWKKKEDSPKKPEAAADSTAAADSADTTKAASPNLDADLDPSNVEVWHWKDEDIQPRQELMAETKRRENMLSVWHLDDHTFVQLADKQFEQVQLTGDQRHLVGYDPNPYEPAFEEGWQDIYLVDVATGRRRLLLEKFEYVRTSPAGQYLLYFKDHNWWTYNIEEEAHTNLTGDIDARFENYHSINGRQNPRPFGAGQWSEDDDWVLIYDEYDAYRVDPDGGEVRKLTDGAAQKIRYRQQYVFTEENYIKDDDPVFFSMYGDTTKMRGYARWDRDEVETLIYEPAMISRLDRAKSADRYVYQKETATDSPDFFYTGPDFDQPLALTRTNPQQEQYRWARDTLITFTKDDGEQLQGRLLYPADYEPAKTYPMITYIYENRSQTMHDYSLPSRTSPYNFRRYSSEGYFVFQPDITYDLRDPGISAVESVVPGVRRVIETGMINEEQIGLTGHSWGAYQTTFIVTQTDLFNSAVAGAPLTNMVSMYNSIYWNTGTPDAQIFETSQGRFPDPWWQDMNNYIENSTIFNLENMNTPLLVEFGTDDGAVDFNQGVELYNTMRRMQKPFVMLVYEGENHGLAREENQIDYATRALQWHEHFLLGREPADWIVEGLPYTERPALQDNGDGQRP